MTASSSLGPMRTVLIAGATGLVGRELLLLALRDPDVREVRVLLRREVNLIDLLQATASDGALLTEAECAKLQAIQVDFNQLARQPALFAVDAVACALGTTIRQAGSQAAFRQVDFDAPLQIARLAHAQGAARFMLVSALGASSQSRVFYSRVKGELEDAIQGVGFAQFTVARPSLLDGHRGEFRFGEALGLVLTRWFSMLIPQSHRAVHVRQVAQGLWMAAKDSAPAQHRVLPNAWLRRMR